MIKSNSELITNYFPDITDEQLSLLLKAEELYKVWNEKINVISRKDIEQLQSRHIIHSLSICKFTSFNPGADILDVGTGGGFPGIPLAIMFPETNFHLIDSIGKKITVVQEVAKGLGLKNVKAEQIRAEKTKGEYDFVVSRAVAKLNTIIPWIRKKIKDESTHELTNGLITLKGGDLKSELAETHYKSTVFDLNSIYNEEFFETKKIVYTKLK